MIHETTLCHAIHISVLDIFASNYVTTIPRTASMARAVHGRVEVCGEIGADNGEVKTSKFHWGDIFFIG